ncbi:MAG: nitroreductase family deazaflavin-dependent oxidoreductase [Acidimicrobiales bacterium]|nr:nitroreductase family deazaflavin-dependent oxidoreductase [Acidimicrobiales bacterium]RZV48589.1 MAG: nitroreductase family deazaflavin-dependent oxidoreductase [Acidimicrobiales bacterium]
MATEPNALKLPGTPKPWMNAAVSLMLKTPGIRSMLGRSMILLAVTGAKTGARYQTPVQYVRDGDRLLVLSQRHRIWWRNIAAEPHVELVLKGKTISTTAHVAQDDEARALIQMFLQLNPRIAKFYGVATDEQGQAMEAGVRQLDEAFVVLVIADVS